MNTVWIQRFCEGLCGLLVNNRVIKTKELTILVRDNVVEKFKAGFSWSSTQ